MQRLLHALMVFNVAGVAPWKMQGCPNAYTEVLTSCIAECDFIWEQAFTEVTKLKRGD